MQNAISQASERCRIVPPFTPPVSAEERRREYEEYERAMEEFLRDPAAVREHDFFEILSAIDTFCWGGNRFTAKERETLLAYMDERENFYGAEERNDA